MTAASEFDLATVTQRLATVEKEVAKLKRHVQQQTADQPCYQARRKFADDPEFLEIVRLGRKFATPTSRSDRRRSNEGFPRCILVGYRRRRHPANINV
jgi:hypothetical protein